MLTVRSLHILLIIIQICHKSKFGTFKPVKINSAIYITIDTVSNILAVFVTIQYRAIFAIQHT